MREANAPSLRSRTAAMVLATLMGVAASDLHAATHAPYDGPTLFRGLFFGSGPVGRLFPDIWDAARYRGYDAEQPGVMAFQASLTERLAARDATFFARFADDVQSGDRVRIASALEEAGRLMATDTETTQLVDESIKKINPIEICVTIIKDLLVIWSTFVFKDEAYFYQSVGVETKPGLLNDLLADSIAIRLGPSPHAETYTGRE